MEIGNIYLMHDCNLYWIYIEKWKKMLFEPKDFKIVFKTGEVA